MSTTTVDDAARALVGTIWFMLVSSTLFLVLRLYCKWRGNGHHWDDAILVAAWVCRSGASSQRLRRTAC